MLNVISLNIICGECCGAGKHKARLESHPRDEHTSNLYYKNITY